MSKHGDALDLHLSERGPGALVLPFPVARRVGKIRRIAETMDRTTKAGAEAIWRRAVSDTRRQLERAGFSTEQVDRELRSLFDAVQAELNRSASGIIPTKPNGGDAA